jgi:hypothetical protein
MSELEQTYYAFWASLLPQSNHQTGFSLRGPTRRSYIEYCRVGLCLRYRLEYDTPNALVEFALMRSDGEQINEAFGGSLLWLRNARSPEQSFPYHVIVWTFLLSVRIASSSILELQRSEWPETLTM